MLIVVGYYSYLQNGDEKSPPVTRLESQSVSSGAVQTENQAIDKVATDGEKEEGVNAVQKKYDNTDQTQATELKEEDIGPEIKTAENKTAEKYPKDNDNTINPVGKEPGFAENIRKTSPVAYPVEKLIVYFTAYSEELAEDATADLYQFLLEVLKYPKAYIVIKGYTDSSGEAEANQRLSAARAEKVKKFFVDKGFYPSRIRAIGLGEKDPIASNTTQAGRDINRRIEIELIQ